MTDILKKILPGNFAEILVPRLISVVILPFFP